MDNVVVQDIRNLIVKCFVAQRCYSSNMPNLAYFRGAMYFVFSSLFVFTFSY